MYFGFLLHLSGQRTRKVRSSVSVSSAASCSWHTAALKAFLPGFGASLIKMKHTYMWRERDQEKWFWTSSLGSGQLGWFRRSDPSQPVLRNLVVGKQLCKSMQAMWMLDRSCCYWKRQIINRCNRNETTRQSEKTFGLCGMNPDLLEAHLRASGPVVDPVEVFRNTRREPVFIFIVEERRKGNVSCVQWNCNEGTGFNLQTSSESLQKCVFDQ